MLGVARKGSNGSVLGHGQGRKLKLAPSSVRPKTHMLYLHLMLDYTQL